MAQVTPVLKALQEKGFLSHSSPIFNLATIFKMIEKLALSSRPELVQSPNFTQLQSPD
jgi:hypothetical protein